MTISFHRSELRKLANSIGYKKAHEALMVKWRETFRQYFKKRN